MRLFVIGNNQDKVYLSISAKNRNELYFKLGYRKCFTIASLQKSINDVEAEPASKNIYFTTFLGLFIGLMFGTLGMAIGGIAGYFFGEFKDSEEKHNCEVFNTSSFIEVEIKSKIKPS